jgi:hypothetical protein
MWKETEYVEYDTQTGILNASIIGGTQLEESLDDLWCSKSPEGSVGFADFLQTFGEVEPNPFGRGDEGEPTLYFLLNGKQKMLYGRITKELDEFEDITLDEIKQVYAALIQDPEVVDVS